MFSVLWLLACSSSPNVELVQHYIESCTSINRGCVETLRIKQPSKASLIDPPIFFDPNMRCSNYRDVGEEVQVDCMKTSVHTTEKNTYGFSISDGKIVKVRIAKMGEHTLSKHGPDRPPAQNPSGPPTDPGR